MKLPDAIESLVASKRLTLSLLVRAGSKAYGIEVEGSDDDYLGVLLPPLRDLVSIPGLERETCAGNDPDYTLHEIAKFCRLALKGNPAILETLWNPNVLADDEEGRRLVALRKKVIHRGSLEVYVDYAESQLKRMPERREILRTPSLQEGGSRGGRRLTQRTHPFRRRLPDAGVRVACRRRQGGRHGVADLLRNRRPQRSFLEGQISELA